MSREVPLLTDDDIRYTGMWWLPENPSVRVPGTAVFSLSEGTTLTLQGGLGDTEPFAAMEDMQVILGRATADQDVTLLDCFETKKSFRPTGVSDSEVFANRMCIGAHLRGMEDACFTAVEFRLSHMDSWVNKSGFTFTLPYSADSRTVIEYRLPSRIQACCEDSHTLSIDFAFRGPALSLAQTEAAIQQMCFFKAEWDRGKPIEECLHTVGEFQHLLSLAAGRPAIPLTINGILADVKLGDSGGTSQEAAIFAPFSGPSQPHKPVLPPSLLFGLWDIEDCLAQVLTRWACSRASLREVHGLYFGTVYSPSPSLERDFLNLVHALEAYHRTRRGGTELPEENHAERLENILKGAPPEHKKWLEEKLRYSNEPSLRARLRQLLLEPPLHGLLGGDTKRFIQRVLDTRNYYVHYDPSLRGCAAKGRELYSLREKLVVLVTACLLDELRLPGADIGERLRRNPRYEYALDTK